MCLWFQLDNCCAERECSLLLWVHFYCLRRSWTNSSVSCESPCNNLLRRHDNKEKQGSNTTRGCKLRIAVQSLLSDVNDILLSSVSLSMSLLFGSWTSHMLVDSVSPQYVKHSYCSFWISGALRHMLRKITRRWTSSVSRVIGLVLLCMPERFVSMKVGAHSYCSFWYTLLGRH